MKRGDRVKVVPPFLDEEHTAVVLNVKGSFIVVRTDKMTPMGRTFVLPREEVLPCRSDLIY